MTSRKRQRDEDAPLVCQWDGCASCVYEDVNALAEHVESVHANIKGTCYWNGCGFVGKTKQSLQTHMRTHTGEKPYTCTVCEKAFAKSGHLTTHMRTHTGEKPYKCERCKNAFVDSGKLKAHMRTHTGEKPYKCTVCDKTFSQLPNLNAHMRRHTGEKPFKCTVCEKAFADSCDLTKHMRTHTGEKPFKCKLCDYESATSLTVHMRAHTGEKPFKCQLCNYLCTTSANLKIHSRTHTAEKPYKCDLCTYTCTVLCSLRAHIRTHTGEKPYKCTACNKSFSVTSSLTVHMRSHTGDYRYKCRICDYACSQSGHLKDHVLRKHTGPWCVTCGGDKPCWVPKENMVCGRCNMHANYGVKEKRFFDFVYAYDERLAEVCFTLRDEAMGCGVRKRPDGLMQLQTKAVVVDIEAAMETTLVEDDYQVKMIIECDEHQHNSYSPSCELARLQEIQERDNDAVYVLRYNVDQPDAFDEAKLGAFCNRIIEVLEGDFLRAVESPTLFEIEYFGYTEARKALLEEEMRRQFGL